MPLRFSRIASPIITPLLCRSAHLVFRRDFRTPTRSYSRLMPPTAGAFCPPSAQDHFLQRVCLDEDMSDVFVLVANSLLESRHGRVPLGAGQVVTKLHIH